MTLFSERMGITKPIDLQIDSMRVETKNVLWNVLKIYLLTPAAPLFTNTVKFTWTIYHKFIRYDLDESPEDPYDISQDIKIRFFNFKWYEVYNFFDVILEEELIPDQDDFVFAINNILEFENSGYRIIDHKVMPITNEIEIEEITTALLTTNKYSSIEEANQHLGKAQRYLADRVQPDYANSIKESISSVESVMRVITGETTLGKAFNKIQVSLPHMNTQLKESFNKIYNFTNASDNGIRHAKVDVGQPLDFEIAKYLLVTSCAFINYLVSQSLKEGLIK